MTQEFDQQFDEFPNEDLDEFDRGFLAECQDGASLKSSDKQTHESAGAYSRQSCVPLQVFPPAGNGRQQAYPRVLPCQTDLAAQVTGPVVRVEMRQRFENIHSLSARALYEFSLPEQAALDDLTVRLGDRLLQSRVQPGAVARSHYWQARQQGRPAALLEQEQGSGTVRLLAEVPPGESMEVTIGYSDRVCCVGGYEQLVLPVGPMAASATGPQPVATRLRVSVQIDAGGQVSPVRSPSHRIRFRREGLQVWVRLAEAEEFTNRDFVLQYQVAGQRTRATVLTQRDHRGGHFVLHLFPVGAAEASRSPSIPGWAGLDLPALTHIQLRWEGEGIPPQIYPAVPLDVPAEQPLIVLGRKPDGLPGSLHLTGITAQGLHYRRCFNLHFDPAGNGAIASLWGRARLQDLTHALPHPATPLVMQAIRRTAIAYPLLSADTALVALEAFWHINT